MSPCTCLRAAKKKSRSSCAPVWKRFSICTRRSSDLWIGSGAGHRLLWVQRASPTMREFYWKTRAKIAGGRFVATRLGRARSLLFLEPGDRTVRSQIVVEFMGSDDQRKPRGLDQVSDFRRSAAVCHSCFSWSEATSLVAVAQPAHRNLRFHWSDSRGSIGGNGPHCHLSFRRPVRQLCCDFRD